MVQCGKKGSKTSYSLFGTEWPIYEFIPDSIDLLKQRLEYSCKEKIMKKNMKFEKFLKIFKGKNPILNVEVFDVCFCFCFRFRNFLFILNQGKRICCWEC